MNKRESGSSKARAFVSGRSFTTFLQLGTIIAFFGGWQFAVTALDVPQYIIPPPTAVVEAMVDGLHPSNPYLLGELWVTLQEILIGFSIGAGGGFALGVLLAEWDRLRVVVNPFLVAIQVTPKTALAPLFVIWFGFGIASKVLIVILITFFPVAVNTIAGIRGVEAGRLDLMRSYRASRFKALVHMKLPAAMPGVFAGLEVAIVFAVLGAIIGEFLGAEAGLGYMVIAAGERLDMALVFGSIALLVAMGLALQGVLGLIKKRVLFWHGH